MAKTCQYRPGRVNFNSVQDDALMVYNGHPVTLRDYRTLMEYEPHVPITEHFFLGLWRWAKRHALRARKREAGRLMKRLGITSAAFVAADVEPTPDA